MLHLDTDFGIVHMREKTVYTTAHGATTSTASGIKEDCDLLDWAGFVFSTTFKFVSTPSRPRFATNRFAFVCTISTFAIIFAHTAVDGTGSTVASVAIIPTAQSTTLDTTVIVSRTCVVVRGVSSWSKNTLVHRAESCQVHGKKTMFDCVSRSI